MVQAAPFQTSVSPQQPPIPPVAQASPTAMQLLADVQDTLVRKAPVSPAGLGGVWAVQVVPSSDSARGREAPVMLSEAPTAMQTLAETHDTLSSKVMLYASEGTGVDISDHLPELLAVAAPAGIARGARDPSVSSTPPTRVIACRRTGCSVFMAPSLPSLSASRSPSRSGEFRQTDWQSSSRGRRVDSASCTADRCEIRPKRLPVRGPQSDGPGRGGGGPSRAAVRLARRNADVP